MTRIKLTAVLATSILSVALAAELRAEPLTDANYEAVRDHVLPKADDLGYQAIAWRPSYWEAVVEAQKHDKPILLWTMNGHPLACT